jgi:two-component system sensor histidine kinase MtrB
MAANRFRRRLMIVFVLVAAASAGTVAAVTFLLAREYRWRNFHRSSEQEARIALALAPSQLDAEGFEQLQAAYEARGNADMLVITPSGVFSSSPALTVGSVPQDLRTSVGRDLMSAEVALGGRPFQMVAATHRGGDRYVLVFSLQELHDSLDELARVAAVAVAGTVVVAGAVGHAVARRTLRPVARVADTAESIASGQLHARLPVGAADEFGVLATSFNRMADTLQELIDDLEEAANRERRFTADVAHELRTPLTGMSATASILEEVLPELPPDARRPAALLVEEVERLRSLVLDLLELARLDAGTGPVHTEPLRLRDAVAAVTHGTGDGAADVDIRLDDELSVAADPVRVRRILVNLIENARVHGAPPILITGRRDGDDVILEVADSGHGVGSQHLPHVFDRFYKSDASRASGGSGLGLAIAREHARAQDGDLVAVDVPGGGARFELRLPCPAGPGSAPAGEPQ